MVDDFKHPVGLYYKAIAMILRLYEVDDNVACCIEGIKLMAVLVAEKNSFALAFKEAYSGVN